MKPILLFAFIVNSSSIWSDNTATVSASGIDSTTASSGYQIELPELPDTTKDAINAYNNCLKSVMSGLESAAIKRERIALDCASQRELMGQAFPESVRELLLENADRRISNIVDTLEAMEQAVDYAVVETRIITQAMLDEELAALNAQEDGAIPNAAEAIATENVDETAPEPGESEG